MALPVRTKKRLGRAGKQRVRFYLFLLPAIVGFSLLTAYPFFTSLFLSFTNSRLLMTEPLKMRGIDNYIYLLTKYPKFWPALTNSAVYAFFNVILTNIIALLSAVFLTRGLKGSKAYRTIFYIPSILPAVSSVIMFSFIFDPSHGIVNTVLLKLGVARESLPLWLANSQSAPYTLILISLWGFGGKMIIYIAGLNAIPKTYYEAAAIDGCKSVRSFFRISLPLVTPSLLYNLILSIIGGLQVFTEAYVGAGGVDYYVGVIYNLAYTGTYQMGLASAMAWLLFIVVAVLVFVNMLVSRFYVTYEY